MQSADRTHAASKARLCKVCKEPETWEKPLTNRGKHIECSLPIAIENLRSLLRKQGEGYDRWMQGSVASMIHTIKNASEPLRSQLLDYCEKEIARIRTTTGHPH